MKRIIIKYTLFILGVLLFSCTNNRSSKSGWEPKFDEEIAIEEKWEDCEQCHGDGLLSRYCPTCDGSGRLIGKVTHTKTRSCPTCFGLGIAPCNSCGNYGYHECTYCTLGYNICPVCDGAGIVIRYDMFFKCSNCSDSEHTGYVMCNVCHGDSKITCEDCGGRGRLDCPTCHGTGGPDITYTETFDQGECPTCNGHGKVYDECFVCEGVGKIKIEE